MIITMPGGCDAVESAPHLITHRSTINCAKHQRDWYANEGIRKLGAIFNYWAIPRLAYCILYKMREVNIDARKKHFRLNSEKN